MSYRFSGDAQGGLGVTEYFPQPANPTATVKYILLEPSQIRIEISDMLGRVVLAQEEYRQAGEYEYRFVGANLSSGVYFSRIITDRAAMVQKIILQK